MSIIEYIKETRVELKHVSWPTKKQSIVFTIVVILLSLGVAIFLGIFDFIFGKGLETLLLK